MFDTIITLIGSAIALTGLYLSFFTYRRGKQLEIFCKYTAKFNEIVTPDELLTWDAILAGDCVSESVYTIYESKMLRYLNLVWEEKHLVREKLIPGKLWRIWEPLIENTLRTEFAQNVADRYARHFDDNFLRFVKSIH